MRLWLLTLVIIALIASAWSRPARAEGEVVVAIAVVAGLAMTYAAADAALNGPDDDSED